MKFLGVIHGWRREREGEEEDEYRLGFGNDRKGDIF